MKIVLLLEESSMKELLDIILPRIIPEDVSFLTIPHEGKSDLQKSIPNKLRGWNEPDVKFVIVHDQDSNDCLELKNELRNLCNSAGKEALIRISCHELESWYFGDLQAVSKAFNIDLTKYAKKSKFRVPDSIENPKSELKKMLPNYGQREGARKIAKYMDISSNTSHSFNVFVSGIKALCEVR